MPSSLNNISCSHLERVWLPPTVLLVAIVLLLSVQLLPEHGDKVLTAASAVVPSLSQTASSYSRKACLEKLHHGSWSLNSSKSLSPGDLPVVDLNRTWSWNNATAKQCGFRGYSRARAQDSLRGKSVIVAGDSSCRFFLLALLRLLLPSIEDLQKDLFKRHSDFSLTLPDDNLTVDFLWAPYATNITERVDKFAGTSDRPRVVVMGTGMWHMLHVRDYYDYEAKLAALKVALSGALQARTASTSSVNSAADISLFWLSVPELITRRLNTEAKRQRMTKAQVAAYNNQLQLAHLLWPQGPCVLIDILKLSGTCGETCTEDGMHYNAATYLAAVQIMLNAVDLLRSP